MLNAYFIQATENGTFLLVEASMFYNQKLFEQTTILKIAYTSGIKQLKEYTIGCYCDLSVHDVAAFTAAMKRCSEI